MDIWVYGNCGSLCCNEGVRGETLLQDGRDAVAFQAGDWAQEAWPPTWKTTAPRAIPEASRPVANSHA
eukprot:14091213-Alexandrium_andersonii.AAC.1